MTATFEAAQRTALAWRRTVLSATGAALLLVNHVANARWSSASAAVLAGGVLLLTVAVVGLRRSTHLRRAELVSARNATRITSAVTVFVCLIAAAVTLRAPGV
ncbi:hypothetical protein P0W64_13465 [Tsukamurella sp. 8F]|uniref:DUF202 domain-containing protein n=1 Tax=unclassified Tsukamurella TaxID=2633480 RepID=UPI0023BA1ABA|nr:MULTISPECIES: DUF202 domain-containing protein [unclassified Tsukamurella]MDF0530398.1 hypothetical protein [Tsukamurella sp. 8J]MDF0587781.1 hypothetical protein [Tsukamurella sp. 8F]